MTQNSVNNSASVFDVDNIQIDGNTISSTNTNGDIVLDPNGTGAVNINSAFDLPTADGSADQVMTTDGAGVASWQTPDANNAQIQVSTVSTVVNVSSSWNFDNTIPQITEGQQVTSVTITPNSASSTLLITVMGYATTNGTSSVGLGLFVTGTSNALGAWRPHNNAGNNSFNFIGQVTVSAGSTSARTYTARMGVNSGNCYVNAQQAGTRLFGGADTLIMTVQEIG